MPHVSTQSTPCGCSGCSLGAPQGRTTNTGTAAYDPRASVHGVKPTRRRERRRRRCGAHFVVELRFPVGGPTRPAQSVEATRGTRPTVERRAARVCRCLGAFQSGRGKNTDMPATMPPFQRERAPWAGVDRLHTPSVPALLRRAPNPYLIKVADRAVRRARILITPAACGARKAHRIAAQNKDRHVERKTPTGKPSSADLERPGACL